MTGVQTCALPIYPPGLEEMEKAVLREMRRIVYRPRLVDGDVVDTQNMIYTHEFFYRESDLFESDESDLPDSEEGEEEIAEAAG